MNFCSFGGIFWRDNLFYAMTLDKFNVQCSMFIEKAPPVGGPAVEGGYLRHARETIDFDFDCCGVEEYSTYRLCLFLPFASCLFLLLFTRFASSSNALTLRESFTRQAGPASRKRNVLSRVGWSSKFIWGQRFVYVCAFLLASCLVPHAQLLVLFFSFLSFVVFSLLFSPLLSSSFESALFFRVSAGVQLTWICSPRTQIPNRVPSWQLQWNRQMPFGNPMPWI